MGLPPSIINPIIPGFHPDPSICRAGDDFYLATSSFEFFPGVPLFHSRNLVDWEQIGHVLTRPSQLPLRDCRPSGGIFAPTIRHHNGRFHMVTTNTNRAHEPNGNFYVWTDDIRGEWSDPLWVDMPGIDPDLFFDDNGDVWFTCTDGQSRIDLESGRLIGDQVERWPGMPGTADSEAPHLFKVNGWYYTMLAEGGTDRGHMVTIARSRRIGGPYEECPRNPILSHRSLAQSLQSTGHADLVEDARGNWWMVFLATRQVGYPSFHLLGRETCLAPVTWDAEGWPVVNSGEPVPLELHVPGLPAPMPKPVWQRDDFDSPVPSLEWNFLRNPDPQDFSMTRHPGSLSLRCSGVQLDGLGSPAWIGRRLQHFDTTLRAPVAFEPLDASEEAGMSLYLQRDAHYDVFVTWRNGGRVVVARLAVGPFRLESEPMPLLQDEAVCSIITGSEWIDLGVETGDGRVSLLKGESKYLSKEVSGRFTGLFASLFAVGPVDGSARDTWARFDWFDYVPERPV